MIPRMDNYYSVLGCDQKASTQEIRQQYKKLALKLHPDKNQNESGNDPSEDFNKLNKAVTTLTDVKEKHKYDSSLLAQRNCNKIVNDEVNLEEFTFETDDQLYFYDCRCGGQFVVSQEIADQLATTNSTQQNLVDCNSCSLCILVTR